MISGGAGFYANDALMPAPVAPAPVLLCPEATTAIEQITCPTVVYSCDAAIKEHAKKHKKEHY